jgi:hypothetical protein
VVYETIKIYSEKFTTNNYENNYKLSYTPKLTYHPTARLQVKTSPFSSGQQNFSKDRNPTPENKEQKKSENNLAFNLQTVNVCI